VFGADRTIDRYVDILTSRGIDWGVIGPREVPRIWERHIWNCAVLAPLLERHRLVCDVGSGAGLPGLVLAIARRDVEVTLIDSMARRVTFLDSAVEELGLDNATVIRGRAGDLGSYLDARFQIVTARAVAPLAKLVEWCAPLIRPGGRLLAIKGRSAEEELRAAREVLASKSVSDFAIEEYGLGIADPLTRVVRIEFPGQVGMRRPKQ
jgi:16S rRNA (guanine527-N7)-methyltransferase